MTHRNADTRIREAFDALASELSALFDHRPTHETRDIRERFVDLQQRAHDFAKLPADA